MIEDNRIDQLEQESLTALDSVAKNPLSRRERHLQPIVQDQKNIVDLCRSLKTQRRAMNRLLDGLKNYKIALTYAYEDHADQYYLNVIATIDKTLADVQKILNEKTNT